MKRIDKVIISCAVTGSIHTPTTSEARPVSAAQIAEQVIKIRRILEDLSLDIATPDEAGRMLNLKGAGRVAF